MPLPFIIGGIAAVAGVAGLGSGIHGGLKMKEASDTMEAAKSMQQRAINLFNTKNEEVTTLLDDIGKRELEILSTFDDFSDLIEKIQGRPEFKAYRREGIDLPEYEAEELKKVSAGAGLLLGGVGGAAAGTAGGFAAAGATTSAVMALGTASTGTAISTLSGAAATNATLAALGGGAIGSSATAGGMALGTAVLGGATLGVGLLVGGVIFNITGTKLSEKADEAYSQATRTKSEVNKIVTYFDELIPAATNFSESLECVDKVYRKHFDTLDHIINFEEKTEWVDFSEKEKKVTENAVLLVGLLHKMCQVKLVEKQDDENDLNKVNHEGIEKAIGNADVVMEDINSSVA
ncbi:hypothetical protein SAMN04487770_13641 [Butyrivibrio sp. ob235]|uniref:hypothetical protein n=1 Tax=Butyrivibrio sp. ob235 TaxID=1761780 RepID=UPI0008CF955F|nr:hypothetical protein [Butyrivibrio sp. ob235]SEM39095.1 hypothetical protein SAMN04487770_13641 [Butyrivibrio sp. ob235]